MTPNQTRPHNGGTITCYNAATPGQPERLRYFAKTNTDPVISWDGRDTEQQAEADIDLHRQGKPVPYVQQAVVPMLTEADYEAMHCPDCDTFQPGQAICTVCECVLQTPDPVGQEGGEQA